MPRPCSICNHPSLKDIQKELARDVPFETLALRYKTTKTSLSRHTTNCLRAPRRGKSSPTVPKRPALSSKQSKQPTSLRNDNDNPLSVSDPKALIKKAERLLDDAQTIVAEAQDEGNSRLALQAIKETRASLELLMKAHNMLGPDSSMTVILEDKRRTQQLFSQLSVEELRALASGVPIAALEKPQDALKA
jgi:hypothetical protein